MEIENNRLDRSQLAAISLCVVGCDAAAIARTCSCVAPMVAESIAVYLGPVENAAGVSADIGISVLTSAPGDLAAAWNLALHQAKSDWVLALDAGEEIARRDLSTVHHLVLDTRFCFEFLIRHYSEDPGLTFLKACEGEYPECEGGLAGFVESCELRLFPNHPGLRYSGMGRAQIRTGAQAAALKIVRTRVPIHHYVSEASPSANAEAPPEGTPISKQDRSELALRGGRRHCAAGRYEESVSDFMQAIELEPRGVEAWLDLGKALTRCRRFSEALESLNAALEIDPANVQVLCQLGVLYASTNNTALAERSFRRVVALNPRHAEAFRQLGAMLTLQGRVREAIETYSEALKFLPESARIRANLGAAYLSLDMPEEAERCLLDAVKTDPALGAAYYNLGKLYRKQDKLDQALQALERFCETIENLQDGFVSADREETLKRAKLEKELLRLRIMARA